MERCDFITELKEGKPEAFDRLYKEFHLPLYRTALLILGNREDAEDVLQETFVTAYLHVRELRSAGSLKAWLFRILTREAYRTGRRARREMPVEPENIGGRTAKAFPGAEGGAEQNGSDTAAEQSGMDSEERLRGQIFRDALSRLDPAHREVLVLYYYDELSTREIAAACRCLEGTVKSRLYTARKRLQRILEQEGYKE